MKLKLTSLWLLILASPLIAQTPSELGILKMPKPKFPAEAKATGLGGRVTVVVEVDQDGNVTAVKEALGPDWVCPSVNRPDVLALRDAAETAALRVKFAPEAVVAGGIFNGSIFRFSKDQVEEVVSFGNSSKNSVKGDRGVDSEKAPTPDYVGPVVAAPADTNIYTTIPSGPPIPAGSLSGGILNGRAKLLPKPPYPRAAGAVRASGAVSIQVLIDEEGKVFSAVPVAGHPLLRSAARLAACQAEFSPTKLSGNPVKVSGIITYNFVF